MKGIKEVLELATTALNLIIAILTLITLRKKGD